MLAHQQNVYGYVVEGTRYDIGKKLDYLRATVEVAIDREDVGAEFRVFLADLVQRRKLL
jgi:UTP--glucose-1-phosphate uridylyltransferase